MISLKLKPERKWVKLHDDFLTSVWQKIKYTTILNLKISYFEKHHLKIFTFIFSLAISLHRFIISSVFLPFHLTHFSRSFLWTSWSSFHLTHHSFSWSLFSSSLFPLPSFLSFSFNYSSPTIAFFPLSLPTLPTFLAFLTLLLLAFRFQFLSLL